MIENRELSMDDYLAMLRRRLKVILIPVLLAPLAGYLVSRVFTARYTSQSVVLVEGQMVPENYVNPVTADFGLRVASMWSKVTSDSLLRAMIENLGIAKPGEEAKAVDQTRANLSIASGQELSAGPAGAGLSGSAKKKQSTPSLSFVITYNASSARLAHDVCERVTQSLLDENLVASKKEAQGTTNFLSGQVENAKATLDAQDKKLAEFKQRYLGQLPEDTDNNLRILMSLNSQLDATTQTLNRAQQDKAYTESLLAQQLAAWKSSQSTTNPQTLEQQLNVLQAQLLQLQGRYTADHPDVIKTKADIAEVQKKLAEVNAASGKATDVNDKASASEPPEIRQLRLQVHQYEGLITQATADQKRLQSSIQLYQNRTAMSPAIEEQYKGLARDYDNAQAVYKDLLAKQSTSELTKSMEDAEQGSHMSIVIPASLPDAPVFPNPLTFAGAGLGAGLAVGLAIAFFLEMRDKSIRTEKDAAAAMDLPLLVSVPWLGDEERAQNSNGRRSFWRRGDSPAGTKDRKKVEV